MERFLNKGNLRIEDDVKLEDKPAEGQQGGPSKPSFELTHGMPSLGLTKCEP
jgi:hypothetical protein